MASISVAVAIGGEVVWQEAFGWADVARRIPATTDTTYPIASISKPLTAAGVMTLDERGLLDISRAATSYLGEGSIRVYAADASAVSIRSILQHRAGLAEQNEYYYPGQTRPPIDDIIRRYAIVAYTPDRRYRYTNIGYGVLEALIARVSGRSYESFMRDDVFLPHGMTRTTVGPAAGSAVLHDAELRALEPYDFASRAAGYIFSTPADLVRFALTRDAKRERMLRERVSTGTATGRYGLDWFCGLGICGRDESAFSYAWHGHDGGMPGASTRMKIVPARDVVVVALSNSRQQLTYDVADEILDILLPEWKEKRKNDPALTPPPAPPPIAIDAALHGAWRGEVVTDTNRAPVSLTIEPTRVLMRVGEQPEAALDELRVTNAGLAGGMTARLPMETPDERYDLWLDVERRGEELIGTISAYSPAPRYHFQLPAWVRLRRSSADAAP